MFVGVGCTQRELCDTSRSHLPVVGLQVRGPTHQQSTVNSLNITVRKNSWSQWQWERWTGIAGLNEELIEVAFQFDFRLDRKPSDRVDTSIDFRFLDMLL